METQMKKLTRSDLYTLEDYANKRNDFRKQVMEHKKHRHIRLGEHLGLYFEDHLTIHYQVQEMLRAERIFDSTGIEDELDAYNPLIPDGNNWKATMMIEYPDLEERKKALTQLIGIEDKIWIRVDNLEPIYAIADEDLERDNADKTSAVHFLRFELNDNMIKNLKGGSKLSIGVDHEVYSEQIDSIPQQTISSLINDLD